MRKSRIILMLVVGLALAGCARPDWIEQTLVTVDVTGTWVGSMGTGNVFREVRLELQQQGSRANGYLRQSGPGMGIQPLQAGPIDGTVGGDVFSFRLTNGTTEGQMTVSGDEMRGSVSVGSGRVPISLRRVDSSAPAPSQQR